MITHSVSSPPFESIEQPQQISVSQLLGDQIGCSDSLYIATAASVSVASAEILPPPPQDGETLSNVPQMLSGEDSKKQRIQRPNPTTQRSAPLNASAFVFAVEMEKDRSISEGLFLSLCFFLSHSLFVTDGFSLMMERPSVVFEQGFRSCNYW